MQRRRLHSKQISEHPNGVDAHLKDDSLAEAADTSPTAGSEAKARRPSGQVVYDDGTKTFFWWVLVHVVFLMSSMILKG